MEAFGNASKDYFRVLKDRSKTSKVYKPYQMTGLMLAEILDDKEHKSLYMRLSKLYDNSDLLKLAKGLEERRNIQNKGAYFMKMLKGLEKKVTLLPTVADNDLDHK